MYISDDGLKNWSSGRYKKRTFFIPGIFDKIRPDVWRTVIMFNVVITMFRCQMSCTIDYRFAYIEKIRSKFADHVFSDDDKYI